MTEQEQKAIKTILAEAAKFACTMFNQMGENPREKISPELEADVQTFENEHEKLMESQNISLKLPVAINILWDGGNDSSDSCFNFYYDADMIDNAVLQTKAFKDFQKETRKFCKKVEAWGDKNFGDPNWFFDNVLN